VVLSISQLLRRKILPKVNNRIPQSTTTFQIVTNPSRFVLVNFFVVAGLIIAEILAFALLAGLKVGISMEFREEVGGDAWRIF
jgi:hypothetical protein